MGQTLWSRYTLWSAYFLHPTAHNQYTLSNLGPMQLKEPRVSTWLTTPTELIFELDCNIELRSIDALHPLVYIFDHIQHTKEPIRDSWHEYAFISFIWTGVHVLELKNPHVNHLAHANSRLTYMIQSNWLQ